MYSPGRTYTFDFVTHNPSTQQVQDADSTPTCEVFKDDGDTAIVTPTVTKRTGKTGNYRITLTLDPDDGFVLYHSYNFVVTATVAGITGKDVIKNFMIVEGDGYMPSSINIYCPQTNLCLLLFLTTQCNHSTLLQI